MHAYSDSQNTGSRGRLGSTPDIQTGAATRMAGKFLSIMTVAAFGLVHSSLGVAENATTQPADSSSDDNQLAEIIVTAEKRDENLQKTPIAVTVLNSETMAQHQVRSLEDIEGLVPGFKMGDSFGISQISIRGVGSSSGSAGSDGEVAVNENGVYVSRSVAQQSGLFDVANIEVLRGPQGTLFGRNATAGAVNITTALPTKDVSGYESVTAGNYGEVRLEAAIGGPIAGDTLMGRIAVFRETRDGYGENEVTGTGIDDKDAYGFRGSLVYHPIESLKGTFIAQYYDEADHDGADHYIGAAGLSGLPGALGVPPLFVTQGGYAPTNVRDIASGIDPIFRLRTLAGTALIDWSSGGPFSVKSITGYRRQQNYLQSDIDGGSTLNLYILGWEPAHQISEEVQLHFDTDRLHLTAGGYYFHENDNASPNMVVTSGSLLENTFGRSGLPPFVTFEFRSADLVTDAYAGFTQGTVNITSALSLTAGVRYSTETRRDAQQFAVSFTTPYPPSPPFPPYVNLPPVTFSATTPKAGIQYQLDPDTMLYASYSKGFKSGGFDTGVGKPTPYNPEYITDYEGGLKTTMLNGRLRADISGFFYDYKGLQVEQVVGTTIQTSNAASAHVYGAEGELSYLVTDAFRIDTNATWTHARYLSYCGADPSRPLITTPSSCPLVDGVLPAKENNFSGKALDNAPDYRLTLDAQYTWKTPVGDFIAKAEAEYSSEFYFSPDNDPLMTQDAYVKGNLFGTYRPNESWELSAYAKNIANKTTLTSAGVATTLVGNPVYGAFAPPRLYGASIQYRF